MPSNNGIEAYPLTWPEGWKRITDAHRKNGMFGKSKQTYRSDGSASYKTKEWLTVSDGVSRILDSLQKMGVDKQDVIISTNVRTRLDGMPRSGDKEPSDPGAAVYWRARDQSAPRCIAIDRYTTVADNLAAIAATFEAMRSIERHGGAEILDRTFTGFLQLAAENDGESWWSILGVEASSTAEDIEAGYKRELRKSHPDVAGGSHEAMQKLNLARDQARAVRR